MAKKIIIVGGGIGGMAAALALHRAGIKVTLYERARVFTEVGAGMSLWPNATRVLNSLGVLDKVSGLGEAVTHFNLLRPDGRTISELSMEGFATPGLCIHRADLHAALLEPLPPQCLVAGQTLTSVVQDGEGVTAHFESGLEVRADGLVGADGIKSVVRSQLHGSKSPSYRGYCIWRGIAPALPSLLRGHISETWGSGMRFGILPIGQGRVCWYATRNSPQSQADADQGRKIELQGLFRNWHPPIADLIDTTETADIFKNDASDRASLRTWGAGQITLLGDAAHPITPNVGQGACMAIEDAACLAKCLNASDTVAQAFRDYEVLRKPRTARIARQARRIGAIGQWENPWVVRGRNAITRLVLSHSAGMQLNAMYSYEV